MATRERVLGTCTAVVLLFGLGAAAVVDDDPAGGAAAGATTTTVEEGDPTTTTGGGTGSTTDETGSSTSTSASTGSTSSSSSSSTTRPDSPTTTVQTATTVAGATTVPGPAPTTAPPATVAPTADLAVYSRVSVSTGAGATRRLRVLLDNAGPTAGGPIELAIDAPTTGPVRLALESSTPGLTCGGFPQQIRCSQSDSPVGGRIAEVIFTIDLGGATCAQGNASFDLRFQVDAEAPDPDPTNNAETRSVCRVD